MQLGVDFGTHFDQQGNVVAGAKACIQAKADLNRIEVAPVLLFETLQSFLEDLGLLGMSFQPALGLFQPGLGSSQRLLVTHPPLLEPF